MKDYMEEALESDEDVCEKCFRPVTQFCASCPYPQMQEEHRAEKAKKMDE